MKTRKNTKYIAPCLIVVIAQLAACASTSIEELRALPPEQKFTLDAPLACVYAKAVEKASSYLGVSEAKFTWFISPDHATAWLRQPKSLISLDAPTNSTTHVIFTRTQGGKFTGQGDDLITYIKSNPCDAKQASH